MANAAKLGVDVVGSPTGRLLEGAGRTLRNTDDVEPIDDDLEGGGTIVEENCTCNGGNGHGPYLYRYYREDVRSRPSISGRREPKTNYILENWYICQRPIS